MMVSNDYIRQVEESVGQEAPKVFRDWQTAGDAHRQAMQVRFIAPLHARGTLMCCDGVESVQDGQDEVSCAGEYRVEFIPN